MSQPSVLRLVQVTDCHIGEHRKHRLAGICTYDTFGEVLAEVAAIPFAPEMLIVTGDVAAQGKRPAYSLFAEQIRKLNIPYAWLPGNHDDFEIMQTSMTSAPYWPLLELGNWRVISLNSAVRGQVNGFVTERELDFLDATLRIEKDHPTVIFLHHPVVPVGCEWLDQQRTANAHEIEEIVAGASNVKAIFCGHVHQEFTADWAGCKVFTTPSTCFQFAANSSGFAMSDDKPAYRWIDLYPNGDLKTGVHHIEMDDHVVDHQVAEY